MGLFGLLFRDELAGSEDSSLGCGCSCQLFRFPFLDFLCLCTQSRHMYGSPRTTSASQFSPSSEKSGIRIRLPGSHSKWLYHLSHPAGPSDTLKQLLCYAFHSRYNPDLGQDHSGGSSSTYVTSTYMVGLPHHGLAGLSADQLGSGTGREVSHAWPWSVSADAISSLSPEPHPWPITSHPLGEEAGVRPEVIGGLRRDLTECSMSSVTWPCYCSIESHAILGWSHPTQ